MFCHLLTVSRLDVLCIEIRPSIHPVFWGSLPTVTLICDLRPQSLISTYEQNYVFDQNLLEIPFIGF